MNQRSDPERARRSPALDQRMSTRTDVAIAVRLCGPQGEFDAWMLDLSATVKAGISVKSWKTMPMWTARASCGD